MDIEITCEIFESISTIEKKLKSKGFSYIEEFILDDIYMENKKSNEFSVKHGRITDALIIRYVNENDKKIICKKRMYDSNGFEISTEKSILKVENIEDAKKHLNMLGYTNYLHMIDKNYMYENEKYKAYIQEVEELGTFLEIEAKENILDQGQEVKRLIEYVRLLNLNMGTEFDVRKAELLYEKQNNC